jgi:hypothetical protein
MDHEALQELLALAALDRLDGDEKELLEEHLGDGCDECARELQSFKQSLGALAMVSAQQGVDARIWNRLEARLEAAAREEDARSDQAILPLAANGHRGVTAIRPGRNAERETEALPRASSGPWKTVAAGSMAAAAALLLFAYQQSVQLTASTSQFRHEIVKLNGQLGEMVTQLAAAHGEVGVLNQELEDRVRLSHILLSPEGLRVELEGSTFLTRVMLAPDANVVKLRPLRRAGGATGLITISPRAGTAILETSGLPINPSDFAYQLWWIAARRTPIKAAVFRVEDDRDAIVLATLPPKGIPLVASAVTLEPASGSELPRGPMYLKGETQP